MPIPNDVITQAITWMADCAHNFSAVLQEHEGPTEFSMDWDVEVTPCHGHWHFGLYVRQAAIPLHPGWKVYEFGPYQIVGFTYPCPIEYATSETARLAGELCLRQASTQTEGVDGQRIVVDQTRPDPAMN